MPIGNTDLVATKNDLIVSLVQRELISKAVVMPSIRDASAFAVKGAKSVAIPRAGSFTVEDPCELYTPSGNSNDFSSWVWFSGMTGKQKDTHPLGYASVFSKPGCTQPVTATITRTK